MKFIYPITRFAFIFFLAFNNCVLADSLPNVIVILADDLGIVDINSYAKRRRQALAGIDSQPKDFDGVDLLPFLSGENKSAPHEFLTWRWGGQSAIREGNWKFLKGGDREYLYDLDADIEEKHSLLKQHPEIASRLRSKLAEWSTQLDPPGLDSTDLSKAAQDYFDFYLDGKPPTRTRTEAMAQQKQSDRIRKERRQPKQNRETAPAE